jgi:hypothetical protein
VSIEKENPAQNTSKLTQDKLQALASRLDIQDIKESEK